MPPYLEEGACMTWLWPVFGFLAGTIAGSFMATIAIRWPQGRSAMRGRSRCDSCDRTLGVVDLIPLMGFAIRRGRCVGCGAAIDRRHLWVEFASGMIGLLAFMAAPGAEGVAGALFGWLLLLLAVLDVEHHWLPDRLTATLAVTGLVAGLLGMGVPIQDRLIGVVVGFGGLALIAITYRAVRKREGMGGGDPKLFGAIGAWLGWQVLPFILLGACLVGICAILMAMARGEAVSRTTRLPLGALLAVAAFPAWLLVSGGLL